MVDLFIIKYRRLSRMYVSIEDYDEVSIRATTEYSALEKFVALCKSKKFDINTRTIYVNGEEHSWYLNQLLA